MDNCKRSRFVYVHWPQSSWARARVSRMSVSLIISCDITFVGGEVLLRELQARREKVLTHRRTYMNTEVKVVGSTSTLVAQRREAVGKSHSTWLSRSKHWPANHCLSTRHTYINKKSSVAEQCANRNPCVTERASRRRRQART